MLLAYKYKSTKPPADSTSSVEVIKLWNKLSRLQKDGSAGEADIEMQTASPEGGEDFNQFVLIKPRQHK